MIRRSLERSPARGLLNTFNQQMYKPAGVTSNTWRYRDSLHFVEETFYFSYFLVIHSSALLLTEDYFHLTGITLPSSCLAAIISHINHTSLTLHLWWQNSFSISQYSTEILDLFDFCFSISSQVIVCWTLFLITYNDYLFCQHVCC